MKILRKICSAVLCAAVTVFMVCSLAEGKEKAGALSSEDFVPADTVAVSDIIEGLTARSAVVTEMTTGRVLFEKEPHTLSLHDALPILSAVTMRSSWCFCSQQKR